MSTKAHVRSRTADGNMFMRTDAKFISLLRIGSFPILTTFAEALERQLLLRYSEEQDDAHSKQKPPHREFHFNSVAVMNLLLRVSERVLLIDGDRISRHSIGPARI